MGDSLKALLGLQEVDTTRDRLRERLAKLPERAQLQAREERLVEIRAAIAEVQRRVDDHIKEMTRLEGELQLIEQKITREEGRLYGGEVVNPKELSALQSEIEMLKRRKMPLEEGVLEQMVERDDGYAEKGRLEAEAADVAREADEIRARIAEAEREINGLLDEEQAKRDGLLPSIPEDSLELYESLREQKKGVGVGALQGGICTACRESLSAVELDRIRQAARAGETQFRCEHCRRILVVT